MPTALIAFDFDPLARIGDTAVRWETIGVAVAIFAALILGGLNARRDDLRVDDLFFVVLGVVPGAVIGGRLGYILLHWSFFTADPHRIVDPSVGSLELTLAVVGGITTGAIVAAILDGRPGRWAQAAALPMLLVLGAGKLAMVLGGSGQGQPTSTDPATAYLGPGPWGSLAPALPSIPSQAIEGIAVGVVLVAMLAVLRLPRLRQRDGAGLLVALAAWALVRVIVASTWRDPAVVGPFRAEQLIALAVLAGSLVLLVVRLSRPAGSTDSSSAAKSGSEPAPSAG